MDGILVGPFTASVAARVQAGIVRAVAWIGDQARVRIVLRVLPTLPSVTIDAAEGTMRTR